MAGAETGLRVELVWFEAPGRLRSLGLELPAGARVEQALAALPAGVVATAVGIWGLKVDPSVRLTDGDRVEVYRPLAVDPMEARRRRHAVQGRRIVSRHRPAPR